MSTSDTPARYQVRSIRDRERQDSDWLDEVLFVCQQIIGDERASDHFLASYLPVIVEAQSRKLGILATTDDRRVIEGLAEAQLNPAD